MTKLISKNTTMSVKVCREKKHLLSQYIIKQWDRKYVLFFKKKRRKKKYQKADRKLILIQMF